jgi:hypothetical protein
MRFVQRSEHAVSRSNVLPIRASQPAMRDDSDLTAFRGLLIAASMSLLFWGVCLTTLWLLRMRS